MTAAIAELQSRPPRPPMPNRPGQPPASPASATSTDAVDDGNEETNPFEAAPKRPAPRQRNPPEPEAAAESPASASAPSPDRPPRPVRSVRSWPACRLLAALLMTPGPRLVLFAGRGLVRRARRPPSPPTPTAARRPRHRRPGPPGLGTSRSRGVMPCGMASRQHTLHVVSGLSRCPMAAHPPSRLWIPSLTSRKSRSASRRWPRTRRWWPRR